MLEEPYVVPQPCNHKYGLLITYGRPLRRLGRKTYYVVCHFCRLRRSFKTMAEAQEEVRQLEAAINPLEFKWRNYRR